MIVLKGHVGLHRMATSASSALLIRHRPGLLWYWMVCLHVCNNAKILLKHLFHFWICFSPVQSLSHAWLSVTPWTAAHQASLSIANTRSLLKLISIESVMPSIHCILCHLLLLLPSIFTASGSFLRSQFFASGGQGIGASTSAQSYQWIFKTDFL